MIKEYKKILETGKSQKKTVIQYLKSLNVKKIKNLDVTFKKSHEEVFSDFNCLECGNCCKKLGPLFNQRDLERISNFLGMKKNDFIREYLKLDEDDDLVFKNTPCPFIDDSNICSIYEVRPKACKEYPHTDQKNMYKYIKLATKNISFCPALYLILEKVKEKLS